MAGKWRQKRSGGVQWRERKSTAWKGYPTTRIDAGPLLLNHAPAKTCASSPLYVLQIDPLYGSGSPDSEQGSPDTFSFSRYWVRTGRIDVCLDRPGSPLDPLLERLSKKYVNDEDLSARLKTLYNVRHFTALPQSLSLLCHNHCHGSATITVTALPQSIVHAVCNVLGDLTSECAPRISVGCAGPCIVARIDAACTVSTVKVGGPPANLFKSSNCKNWGFPSLFIQINQGINGHTTRAPPGVPHTRASLEPKNSGFSTLRIHHYAIRGVKILGFPGQFD